MDFNNGNEVEGFIPSNDKDNTDNGLPQLRSYTGPEVNYSYIHIYNSKCCIYFIETSITR